MGEWKVYRNITSIRLVSRDASIPTLVMRFPTARVDLESRGTVWEEWQAPLKDFEGTWLECVVIFSAEVTLDFLARRAALTPPPLQIENQIWRGETMEAQ